jgi:hypothetical protein
VSHRRLRHGCALAAAVAFAAPASALAAYAPKLSVTVDPPAPHAPSRIVSTITQAAGETASRRVVVTLPAGFAIPVQNLTALPACTTQQLNARACPESTRIGSAAATASFRGLPVPLSGPVVWGGPTGDGRFVIEVQLNNDSANQHLTLRGVLSLNSAGGFDTTFDDLPSTATTRFSLTFDGGAKAIVLTPSQCGSYAVTASFVSQNAETAQASAPVEISGCAPPTAGLHAVKATATRLTYRLTSPAPVHAIVKGGPGDRKVVDRHQAGRAGSNRVRLPRTLRPGRYRISVLATNGDGTVQVKKARLTIRARRAR